MQIVRDHDRNPIDNFIECDGCGARAPAGKTQAQVEGNAGALGFLHFGQHTDYCSSCAKTCEPGKTIPWRRRKSG